jgi:hypothetical protein
LLGSKNERFKAAKVVPYTYAVFYTKGDADSGLPGVGSQLATITSGDLHNCWSCSVFVSGETAKGWR